VLHILIKKLQNGVDIYFQIGHFDRNMISILSRLICPVAKCVKYGSHLSVFRNREYHLCIAMRNYTVSASYEIENDNI